MRKIFSGLIFLFCISTGFCQSEGIGPLGFRGITLGLSVDKVKSLLLEDPYFDYRGEPDVSFLPDTSQKLIEVDGFSFIKKAYFQFYEEKLYILILILDEDKIDYYTMFTTLVSKYGEFTTLNPKKVVWEFEDVVFSLEKPLSVKYIDRAVFNQLQEEGVAEEQWRDISRENFLKEF
jgi:hypothetical protein